MPHEGQVIVETYQIFMLIGGILGVFALVWRTWLGPISNWRKDINEWKVKVDYRLEHGDKALDQIRVDIQGLDNKIDSIKETIVERLHQHEQRSTEKYQEMKDFVSAQIWQAVSTANKDDG